MEEEQQQGYESDAADATPHYKLSPTPPAFASAFAAEETMLNCYHNDDNNLGRDRDAAATTTIFILIYFFGNCVANSVFRPPHKQYEIA